MKQDKDINFAVDFIEGHGYMWSVVDGSFESEYFATEEAAVMAATEAGYFYREPDDDRGMLFVDSVRCGKLAQKAVICNSDGEELWQCLHRHYSRKQAVACANKALMY